MRWWGAVFSAACCISSNISVVDTTHRCKTNAQKWHVWSQFQQQLRSQFLDFSIFCVYCIDNYFHSVDGAWVVFVLVQDMMCGSCSFDCEEILYLIYWVGQWARMLAGSHSNWLRERIVFSLAKIKMIDNAQPATIPSNSCDTNLFSPTPNQSEFCKFSSREVKNKTNSEVA